MPDTVDLLCLSCMSAVPHYTFEDPHPCVRCGADLIEPPPVPRGRKPADCPGACSCVTVCGQAVIDARIVPTEWEKTDA